MTPRTVAIYRLLYGSDFIGESLASIYDHTDRILCFVSREVFGGRRVVSYFGHDLYIPHDIDGLSDAIHDWKRANDPAGKVEVITNPYGALLKGQVSRMVNEMVLPRYDCTHLLFVEADEVWHADALARLLRLAATTDDDEYMAGCHLFWRSYKYASTRTNPYCVLRALKGRTRIGTTGHALAEVDTSLSRRAEPGLFVHNFGYAASARTAFWKHITGLSFSRDARLDSVPREEWFEQVWRPWNWHTNRRTDLCPSVGHPTAFAPAAEYPFDELPEPMKQRIRDTPLEDWRAADATAPARAGSSTGVAA